MPLAKLSIHIKARSIDQVNQGSRNYLWLFMIDTFLKRATYDLSDVLEGVLPGLIIGLSSIYAFSSNSNNGGSDGYLL